MFCRCFGSSPYCCGYHDWLSPVCLPHYCACDPDGELREWSSSSTTQASRQLSHRGSSPWPAMCFRRWWECSWAPFPDSLRGSKSWLTQKCSHRVDSWQKMGENGNHGCCELRRVSSNSMSYQQHWYSCCSSWLCCCWCNSEWMEQGWWYCCCVKPWWSMPWCCCTSTYCCILLLPHCMASGW